MVFLNRSIKFKSDYIERPFIDWKNIANEEDFYNSILPQLDAPEWHGRNLDALSDSLVGGGINGIEPP